MGTQDVVIGTCQTLHSEVLDEDREICIFSPDIDPSSEQQYPVLYLLDGESYFHHATGLVEFLSRDGTMFIPKMIVVGINNVNRDRDFTPTAVNYLLEENPGVTREANMFLRFLEQELIPMIDAGYLTAPYRILEGHSLGGLFAWYAFLEKPDLFQAYLVIDLSIGWDDNWLLREIPRRIQKSYPSEISFYTGCAGFYYEKRKEDSPLFLRENAYRILLNDIHAENLRLEIQTFSDHHHLSVPHQAMYEGLQWIFKDFRMPNGWWIGPPQAIETHYEALARKYGFPFMLSKDMLLSLNYEFELYARQSNSERHRQRFQNYAIEALHLLLKYYPESPDVSPRIESLL